MKSQAESLGVTFFFIYSHSKLEGELQEKEGKNEKKKGVKSVCMNNKKV